MSRDRFEEQHQDGWQALDLLVGQLERRQPAPAAGDLPVLYRQLCHQLALARSRRYGVDLEQRLNRLALRAHQQLYHGRRATSWAAVGRFVRGEFPRRVRALGGLFWLSLALFAVPLLGTFAAIQVDSEAAYAILSPAEAAKYENMYAPENQQEDRGAASDFGMFGFYIYNNISIAFRTFAGGMLFGLGSIFFLVFNGFAIGAVAGHLGQAGLGETFYPFVIAHGSFELTAIVLAGAAGLKLGLALLSPGRASRARSLAIAAKDSVPLVYGIAGMLLVAAFIEAFWSSTHTLPGVVRYGVGTVLWVLVVGYLALAGRGRES